MKVISDTKSDPRLSRDGCESRKMFSGGDKMKQPRLLITAIILMLLVTMSVSCATPNSTPTLTPSPSSEQIPAEESAELQPRGNGTVELVTDTVHDGTHSAKLAIPENYNFGDAARIAVPLEGITLNDITSLSFWCYVDMNTPVNPDGRYWVPYITFELDTDGEPGCDTWVIGGGDVNPQSSGLWFKNTMESTWMFHVSSVFADYTSPFPLSDMGTLAEIKTAKGPDGSTLLGDCIVSKVRLAIGNWGEGGPIGPVICYVDHLIINGRLLF